MQTDEFQQAFQEKERKDQISNSILASILSMILMPLGAVMDHFVVTEKSAWVFLKLRLASSVVVGLAWLWFHLTHRKHYRVFGVMWYAAPAFFIAWMIRAADNPAAPYYAGLNLVLVALGLLSPSTYFQNLLSAAFVIVLYLAASSRIKGGLATTPLFNNLFFLVSTASIVVAGSYASFRQRLREFQLTWELDQNRKVVEDANQKLRQLDETKSRFFANVSHELRTPLTLLLAPLEALLIHFKSSGDGETRNTLLTMRSNGMRLLKLINDLLDLVRLESGRMEVKHDPLEVEEFINGLASAARQVANDKRLTLETRIDPELGTVLADRDKLEKMLLNLVFNALKFTPPGGRVEVRAEKQASEWVLTVADTGMGISPKNLPYVFDRFWQADDSSKRKYQGVGIGLALVKELTEIQGGKVSVESQVGIGTSFTIRLPLAKPESPAPAAITEKSAEPAEPATPAATGTVTSEEWLANLYRRAELFPTMTPVQDSLRPVETWVSDKRRRLLVADDEPDMLRFLKSQLSRDYQVLEAVDGQQAIEKAAQFLPDIILLDMMMPEKDGLQACRELRERTSTQSIPIVLLTARADEETKLAALEAGASDFLAKPFSTTELHVRIKNLVEAYEYQRKLSKQNQVLEQTIDQLKETETQLVQSEKMASLGRLSAGIIHEINNPLNFVTTGLFTLRNKGKYLQQMQQTEYSEVLKDVEEGISRVKDIVSDLRSFSCSGNDHREDVSVADAVSSALKFLSHEWKDEIEIHQQIPPEQMFSANRNKMIQVLLNLLQNSVDALADKPWPAGEKPGIWIEGQVGSERTLLIVRDNGTGIDPKNLDKIFDPFFTTKDVGQGMGLGLSICYRIVQEFEGRIQVKSELGQYCEFTLDFPAVNQPAPALAVSA